MEGKKWNKRFFHGLGGHQGSISLSVQTPAFTLWLGVSNHSEQSWHKRGKGHHGELLCLFLELSGNFFKNGGRNARAVWSELVWGSSPNLWMFRGNSAGLTPQVLNENKRQTIPIIPLPLQDIQTPFSIFWTVFPAVFSTIQSWPVSWLGGDISQQNLATAARAAKDHMHWITDHYSTHETLLPANISFSKITQV